jgi:hypothetical protein
LRLFAASSAIRTSVRRTLKAGVCTILRKMVHYELIPQNLVAKRGVGLQHQAQYARRLGEHYKVIPQNAAWGLKHHAQDGTL